MTRLKDYMAMGACECRMHEDLLEARAELSLSRSRVMALGAEIAELTARFEAKSARVIALESKYDTALTRLREESVNNAKAKQHRG